MKDPNYHQDCAANLNCSYAVPPKGPTGAGFVFAATGFEFSGRGVVKMGVLFSFVLLEGTILPRAAESPNERNRASCFSNCST